MSAQRSITAENVRTASPSFSEGTVGTPPGVAEGVKEGMASPQGFSPTSATPCHTPRPSKQARTRNPGQDPPMPPTPSSTDERLRDIIAKRMRMSHIDQPLMLMELLGHGFARPQPARPPRRT